MNVHIIKLLTVKKIFVNVEMPIKYLKYENYDLADQMFKL